jgi:hypothetical protein
MASRTFWQSLWFLLAFYLVWPVMFSTFVLEPNPRNYWFYVVGSVLGPSQGMSAFYLWLIRNSKFTIETPTDTMHVHCKYCVGFFNACIFFNRQRKIIRKKLLNMLGIESKPNASTNPINGNEALAKSAAVVEAGISSESPVALSENILNKQGPPARDISMRLSDLHLDSNGNEDCKEEEEPSMSRGAIEHAQLAGLCDEDDDEDNFE